MNGKIPMDGFPSKDGVYFLELALENVRCFGEKTTIDLRDPSDKEKPARWTVIIGENGVGKTTVLRSLVSVGPDVKPSKDGGVSAYNYSPAYRQFSSLWNAARSEKHSAWSVKTLKCGGISMTNKGLTESWVYRFAPMEEYSVGIKLMPTTQFPIGFKNACFTVLAYGASRHMGTNGIEEDPLKNASLSLFQDNAELTNASELFHQTFITATKEGDSRLHDKLKKIILTVLPEITDIRAEKGSGFSWRAEVLTPYGWVWIHDLSLGYKTMVAWIVDFAAKLFLLHPDSAAPLAEPAICLVDEIDLHMHPVWQRDIMDFLTTTFPNTQFIVTAHSPLMVQAAAEANIVLLKREGDHVVVENDPIVVKNWSVDQILSSVFGVSPRLEETEQLIARRRSLLRQETRSAEENEELEALKSKLQGYSPHKTADEMEAASLLKEFIDIIKARKAAQKHD